jgi:hypothetical protein
MESGRMMLVHSIIIGLFLYFFLLFVVRVNQPAAENRSILVASSILIYMVLFGHGLPIAINKDI